ncbi:hypothetical protein AWB78_02388 [Caballeronia calidae]|uniref:Uncharacterized protein n=1 Tax=Caballeronia calidae TaxID=1777139 RepID=A0A158B811_9BURK|nr:hypothetical protein [Caballeronia calidae]SAK66183.1 hypothetical protein AWB78_02388 [Caballeronia calidae]
MKSNRKARKGTVALAIIASACAAVFVPSGTALATDGNGALVYPPSSTIAGKTYAEWSAKWWQYVFPIPYKSNPTIDTTGAYCDVAQRGPVWFLAGGPNGPVTRRCTIYAQDKPIFFPIINVECSTQDVPQLTYPNGFYCTDGDSCKNCAQYWGGLVTTTSLTATVDGHDVTGLEHFRFTSAPFKFEIPKNNILDPTGAAGTGLSVSDGYWLMLKPLAPGHHTLHFHGEIPSLSFTVDVTYDLVVAE